MEENKRERETGKLPRLNVTGSREYIRDVMRDADNKHDTISSVIKPVI